MNEVHCFLCWLLTEESKPSLHFGKIEQACVAKYEDGAWYRGKIIEVNGSEANILFVDYGNQQRGPLGSLKAIDEEFTKLPPQAYHCTLRMVPHCDEKAKFEEAVTGKTLQASFYRIGSDKKYETKLFCEENGVRAVINEQFGAPATDSVPAPSTDFTPLSFDTVALEVSIAWFYNVNRFFLSPSDLSPYQVVASPLFNADHPSSLSRYFVHSTISTIWTSFTRRSRSVNSSRKNRKSAWPASCDLWKTRSITGRKSCRFKTKLPRCSSLTMETSRTRR